MIAFFKENEPFSRNKAVVFVMIAALLWSTNGLFIKIIDLGPLTIVGVRSIIAAALMIAIYNKNLRFNWSFPQLAGAVMYSTTVILFVSATKMTTAANVVFLHYTAPVFTALFGAWLLKERVSRLDWAILLMVLAGMALFFVDDLVIVGLWGNIMAIISAVTFAFMILFLRFQKDGSTLETIVLGNIITALVCSFFIIQEPPSTSDWLPLIYMGTLQIGLSFIMYCSAIKYIAALDAVLVQTVEPLLNPIWVFIIIGEAPGNWAIAGGMVVLTAVTLRNIYISRKVPAKTGAAV